MSYSRKFNRLPPLRLAAIWDALNLLRLLSTHTEPFDMVSELCDRVHWFGTSKLARQLQGALAYVEGYANHYDMRPCLKGYNTDAVPEQKVDAWACVLVPSESLRRMILDAKSKKPRRRAKPKPRKATKQPSLPLYDSFPWLLKEWADAAEDSQPEGEA